MSNLKHFIVTVERKSTIRIPIKANSRNTAARLVDSLIAAGHYDEKLEDHTEEQMSVDEVNEMTYAEVKAEEE